MKKFVMMMAMFLFLSPALGLAADVRNAEVVGKDAKVSNLYLAGQNPTVDANVIGDLVVAGGMVTVNGGVAGGIIAAGSTLNLMGSVGQSVRVAGSTILIDGAVGGDVVIFGGNVTLGTKSVVSGDVIVFGGTLDMKGKVLGSVKNSYVGSVNLSGSVAGDVTFSRVGTLVVTSEASVTGGLKYSSQNEGTVSSSAKIGGKTEFTKVAANNQVSTFVPNLGTILFGLLIGFVTLMAFILLAPKFAKNVVNNVLVNPWAKLGIGFLALVAAPVAMLVFAITVLGLGIAGYLVMLYVALIALTGALSAVFAGSYAWKLARKEKEFVVDWKTVSIGLILVAIAKFVPIIGWLAAFILFLLVFGTLVTMSFDFVKAQRA